MLRAPLHQHLAKYARLVHTTEPRDADALAAAATMGCPCKVRVVAVAFRSYPQTKFRFVTAPTVTDDKGQAAADGASAATAATGSNPTAGAAAMHGPSDPAVAAAAVAGGTDSGLGAPGDPEPFVWTGVSSSLANLVVPGANLITARPCCCWVLAVREGMSPGDLGAGPIALPIHIDGSLQDFWIDSTLFEVGMSQRLWKVGRRWGCKPGGARRW